MILIIDNYDSFTYNLYQLVQGLTNNEVVVRKNDQITLSEIIHFSPVCIVLSPGSGIPQNSGVCLPIIEEFSSKIPILGVCLGHQIIAIAYGGVVEKAEYPLHGKSKEVIHNYGALFNNVPQNFMAARYNSLIVNKTLFPHDLVIEANDRNGEIMALRHKNYPLYGIQFHPESILTPYGENIIRNFLEIAHVKTIS